MLLFLGDPNQSSLKKATAAAPSMCEKGAFAKRVMLRDSKENKLSWMLSLSAGGIQPELGMCGSLSELTPLQSHSHCCRQMGLHPNHSVILYPTLTETIQGLSYCHHVSLIFIHIFTATCTFDLGQSQGATEGQEYLSGDWDLFSSFDFPLCPGEGEKGHVPASLSCCHNETHRGAV